MASDRERALEVALKDALGFCVNALRDLVQVPGFDPETHVVVKRGRAALASLPEGEPRGPCGSEADDEASFRIAEAERRGFREGVEAMRDAIASHFAEEWSGDYVPTVVAAIRALVAPPGQQEKS